MSSGLKTCHNDEQTIEAGVDEVARGCLFGPVFAGAVILSPNVPLHKWLNDSKKVTKKRRAEVRKWIEKNAIAWNVAFVSNETINKINIRESSLLAMELAIRGLSVTPELLVVDGNYFHGTESFGSYDAEVLSDAAGLRITQIPHVTVVGGDANYASIAAASVLAKEHHDEYIRNMIAKEPDFHEKYNLLNNVGYGSPKHMAGLREHGPSKYHRTTFLRKILQDTIYRIELPKPSTLLIRDYEEDDQA